MEKNYQFLHLENQTYVIFLSNFILKNDSYYVGNCRYLVAKRTLLIRKNI